MPNIVTNHIEFATEHDCIRARDMMTTSSADFDFNTLMPMPNELNVAAGTKGIEAMARALDLNTETSEKDVKKLLVARFPNLSDDYVDELAENIASATTWPLAESTNAAGYAVDGFPEGRRPLTFEAYGQQLLQNLANHGSKDWYDWRIEHWGVKWNADNVLWSECEVRFETAWEPVPELTQELARKLNVPLFYEYVEESFNPEDAGAVAIGPDGSIIACASPHEADEWDRLFFEQGSPEWLITFLHTKDLADEIDEPVDFSFGPYEAFLDAVRPAREAEPVTAHASRCSTFELLRDERVLYFPGSKDTKPAPDRLYDAFERDFPNMDTVLNSPTLDLLFQQRALGEHDLGILRQAMPTAIKRDDARPFDITREDIVLEHCHENVYYTLARSEDGTFTFWSPENDLLKHDMRIMDDARPNDSEDRPLLPTLGEPVVITTSVVWPHIVSTWFSFYDLARNEGGRRALQAAYPPLQIDPIDPATLPPRANLFRRNRKAYRTEQRATGFAANTQQPPMQPEQLETVNKVLDDPKLNPHSTLLERLLIGPALNRGEGAALQHNAETLLSGAALDEVDLKRLFVFHRGATYRVLGGDRNRRLITLLDRDADAFVTKRIAAHANDQGEFPQTGDLICIDVAALDPDLIAAWEFLYVSRD